VCVLVLEQFGANFDEFVPVTKLKNTKVWNLADGLSLRFCTSA